MVLNTTRQPRKPRRAPRFGDAFVQTTIRLEYEAIVQVNATPDRETRMERLGPFQTPEQARTVGDRRLRALRRELSPVPREPVQRSSRGALEPVRSSHATDASDAE